MNTWKQHTAHFSTFPALLAHFTRESRRTNNCLVRLANWTISIFLNTTMTKWTKIEACQNVRQQQWGVSRLPENLKTHTSPCQSFWGVCEKHKDKTLNCCHYPLSRWSTHHITYLNKHVMSLNRLLVSLQQGEKIALDFGKQTDAVNLVSQTLKLGLINMSCLCL